MELKLIFLFPVFIFQVLQLWTGCTECLPAVPSHTETPNSRVHSLIESNGDSQQWLHANSRSNNPGIQSYISNESGLPPIAKDLSKTPTSQYGHRRPSTKWSSKYSTANNGVGSSLSRPAFLQTRNSGDVPNIGNGVYKTWSFTNPGYPANGNMQSSNDSSSKILLRNHVPEPGTSLFKSWSANSPDLKSVENILFSGPSNGLKSMQKESGWLPGSSNIQDQNHRKHVWLSGNVNKPSDPMMQNLQEFPKINNVPNSRASAFRTWSSGQPFSNEISQSIPSQVFYKVDSNGSVSSAGKHTASPFASTGRNIETPHFGNLLQHTKELHGGNKAKFGLNTNNNNGTWERVDTLKPFPYVGFHKDSRKNISASETFQTMFDKLMTPSAVPASSDHFINLPESIRKRIEAQRSGQSNPANHQIEIQYPVPPAQSVYGNRRANVDSRKKKGSDIDQIFKRLTLPDFKRNHLKLSSLEIQDQLKKFVSDWVGNHSAEGKENKKKSDTTTENNKSTKLKNDYTNPSGIDASEKPLNNPITVFKQRDYRNPNTDSLGKRKVNGEKIRDARIKDKIPEDEKMRYHADQYSESLINGRGKLRQSKTENNVLKQEQNKKQIDEVLLTPLLDRNTINNNVGVPKSLLGPNAYNTGDENAIFSGQTTVNYLNRQNITKPSTKNMQIKQSSKLKANKEILQNKHKFQSEFPQDERHAGNYSTILTRPPPRNNNAIGVHTSFPRDKRIQELVPKTAQNESPNLQASNKEINEKRKNISSPHKATFGNTTGNLHKEAKDKSSGKHKPNQVMTLKVNHQNTTSLTKLKLREKDDQNQTLSTSIKTNSTFKNTKNMLSDVKIKGNTTLQSNVSITNTDIILNTTNLLPEQANETDYREGNLTPIITKKKIHRNTTHLIAVKVHSKDHLNQTLNTSITTTITTINRTHLLTLANENGNQTLLSNISTTNMEVTKNTTHVLPELETMTNSTMAAETNQKNQNVTRVITVKTHNTSISSTTTLNSTTLPDATAENNNATLNLNRSDAENNVVGSHLFKVTDKKTFPKSVSYTQAPLSEMEVVGKPPGKHTYESTTIPSIRASLKPTNKTENQTRNKEKPIQVPTIENHQSGTIKSSANFKTFNDILNPLLSRPSVIVQKANTKGTERQDLGMYHPSGNYNSSISFGPEITNETAYTVYTTFPTVTSVYKKPSTVQKEYTKSMIANKVFTRITTPMLPISRQTDFNMDSTKPKIYKLTKGGKDDVATINMDMPPPPILVKTNQESHSSIDESAAKNSVLPPSYVTNRNSIASLRTIDNSATKNIELQPPPIIVKNNIEYIPSITTTSLHILPEPKESQRDLKHLEIDTNIQLNSVEPTKNRQHSHLTLTKEPNNIGGRNKQVNNMKVDDRGSTSTNKMKQKAHTNERNTSVKERNSSKTHVDETQQMLQSPLQSLAPAQRDLSTDLAKTNAYGVYDVVSPTKKSLNPNKLSNEKPASEVSSAKLLEQLLTENSVNKIEFFSLPKSRKERTRHESKSERTKNRPDNFAKSNSYDIDNYNKKVQQPHENQEKKSIPISILEMVYSKLPKTKIPKDLAPRKPRIETMNMPKKNIVNFAPYKEMPASYAKSSNILVPKTKKIQSTKNVKKSWRPNLAYADTKANIINFELSSNSVTKDKPVSDYFQKSQAKIKHPTYEVDKIGNEARSGISILNSFLSGSLRRGNKAQLFRISPPAYKQTADQLHLKRGAIQTSKVTNLPKNTLVKTEAVIKPNFHIRENNVDQLRNGHTRRTNLLGILGQSNPGIQALVGVNSQKRGEHLNANGMQLNTYSAPNDWIKHYNIMSQQSPLSNKIGLSRQLFDTKTSIKQHNAIGEVSGNRNRNKNINLFGSFKNVQLFEPILHKHEKTHSAYKVRQNVHQIKERQNDALPTKDALPPKDAFQHGKEKARKIPVINLWDPASFLKQLSNTGYDTVVQKPIALNTTFKALHDVPHMSEHRYLTNDSKTGS